jgi:hypothetical protein
MGLDHCASGDRRGDHRAHRGNLVHQVEAQEEEVAERILKGLLD